VAAIGLGFPAHAKAGKGKKRSGVKFESGSEQTQWKSRVLAQGSLILAKLQERRYRSVAGEWEMTARQARLPSSCGGRGSIESRAGFVARLQKAHGRKYGFWELIESKER
jgi:hypothetical protein